MNQPCLISAAEQAVCLLFQGRVPFGGEEKDEKTVTGHERGLRGRGLCLVPVSLISQVYHDDTLPDCWTPAYPSCLYR